MLLLAGLAAADSAPPIFLKTNGTALFSMMIFFFATIIFSAHIEKINRIFIYLCLLLMGFMFVFDHVDFRINLTLIAILGFLGVYVGSLLESRMNELTSGYTKKIQHRMIFLTVLTLLILFSAISMIDREPGPAHKSMWADGSWSKLHLLRGVTWYNTSSQTFTATFINDVGTPIMIKKVSINETLSNVTCTEQGLSTCTLSYKDSILEPACTEATLSKNVTLGQGEALRIDAVCTGANKKDRDSCYMYIEIIYEYYRGGFLTTRTESGRIYGHCGDL